MKYLYPKMTNTLVFKRVSDDEIYIKDCSTDCAVTVPLPDAWFLCQLDGFTDPYSFGDIFTVDEIEDNIAFFDECGLLRYRDVRRISFFSWLFPIIHDPFKTRISRRLARIWNAVLMLSWSAVLLCGVVLFGHRVGDFDFDFSIFGLLAGVIVGLACGLCLHEAGHACASVAYGARVFECGFFVMHIVGLGAYVMSDDSDVRHRMQRVQIYAAGVETNFLLTGLFLIAAVTLPIGCYGWTIAALENLILALINLLPIDGIDGSRILALFLGIRDPYDSAKKVTASKRLRQEIRACNRCGNDAVFMFYVLRIMQFLLPIFYLESVLEVFAWIFL